MNQLPNCKKSLVEEQKIRQYLLDLSHEDGKSKAKFFLARGFTVEHWQALAQALCQHGIENQIAKTLKTPFGQKFIIECHLATPDRQNPCIRTVWIIEDGNTIPRLSTAYPHL
ncbi:MAG: hypothetical protein KME35_02680 [Aphanocapsa sp. GSE-SYN-MK-11-07L]|nr:hypothetical protein [Aphanocapsa sp. GSE-SYN-MK-11-07L]